MASTSPDAPDSTGIDLKEVALVTVVVLAVIAAAVLAYFLLDVLLLFFLGVVLAAALQPLHLTLCRWGLPRSMAVLLIYVVILLVIGLLCLIVGPALVEQLSIFANGIPDSYTQFLRMLRSSNTEPIRVIGRRLPSFDALLRSAAEVSPELYESALGLTSGIIGIFTFFATVLVVAFYWTLEVPRLERLFVSLLPVSRRPRALQIWHEIEFKLGAFIRGQGLAMLIIGVASGIGYAIIGLPNVLVLAVLAGLMEAIPLVGPVLAAIPAIAVAMPMGLNTVMLVIGLSLLLQAVENNILIPRIMSHATGVSALVSIFAVLAFGTLYGVLGVFIAIPMMAVAQVVLDRLLLETAAPSDTPAQDDPLKALHGRVSVIHQHVRGRLRARESRMGIDPSSVDHVIDAVDQQIETTLERIDRMVTLAEQLPASLRSGEASAIVEALESAIADIEFAMQRVDALVAEGDATAGSKDATNLPTDELEAAAEHAEQAVARAETVLAASAESAAPVVAAPAPKLSSS